MKLICAFLSLFMFTSTAFANAEVGKLAPNFTATDMYGKTVSLEDYRGKIVVLEWNNPECPFVVKYYQNGDMQQLQTNAANDDIVWLTINSGAEGKQGYMSSKEAQENFKAKNSASTTYLLDADGSVGKLYDAKTTPHMYVIDPEGMLVYAGAIDSVSSFDSNDIADATNYVTQALTALKAGKEVEVSSTKPYGCSVKYAD